MQAPDPPTVPEPISPRILQASLSLSSHLLEANSEEAILRAAMRVGCEILSAEGCLFMPFGEFLQTFPALEFGRVPVVTSTDLKTHLTSPAVRQTCKVCGKRHAGPECILLNQDPTDHYNQCVPVRLNGREAGLFSFIFSARPQVDKETEWFLEESMRLTAIALDSFRLRARESASPFSRRVKGEPQKIEGETRAILAERTRLSREIHDGLAQTLAFLKIEIGRAENLLSQGQTEQAGLILQKSSRTLSDAYLDAREAIENLRRVSDGRLDTWLKQTADDFKSLTGLHVEVDVARLGPVAPNVQAQLIRIVQEALTNIRKHAGAGVVRLAAREVGSELIVEVQDDGRGFASADSLAAARFGLRGMRERAETIGADFQIVSRPGEGTTVRLRVPLFEGVKP